MQGIKSCWLRGVAAVAVLGMAMAAAQAQETTGSISGTVTDSTGAAIKGATVTLTNTDRNQKVRTLTTNGDGFYTATSLPLGTYTVGVTDGGFKTEAVTGLVLHVNDALTVNRTLKPGSAGETVTVQADQVQLNLQNGMSQGLINGVQIRELPLNNRNYEQLLLLQPGVSYGGASDQLYIGNSLPSGTSNTVAFSVNGSRPTANNWTIDGADNVDRGTNLTLLTYPSVDAIQEFKTLRGTYTAEFGRSASGQINVVTRSGTNSLHGSAYEFFRNDILNANRYFNNLQGISRPLLRYNDFGYTVGGPVYIPKVYDGRNKTFFFVSQEFRRIINYAAATALLPTDYERNGDFRNAYYRAAGTTTTTQGPLAVCTAYTQTATSSTCNTYGTQVTNISPTAAAYLKDIYNKLPVPNAAANVAAGFDPHTYSYNQRNVFNNTQEFVRIDEQVSSRLSAFYRYLHDSLPSYEAGGLFNASNPMPLVPMSSTLSPGTQHLGHATYVFSPRLLLDVGYAFSYGAIISTPVGLEASTNSQDIKPNLPYGAQLGIVPTLLIGGLTNVASAGQYNDYNRNHNVFGNVTWTLGQHTFKAGGTYNHYQKQENATGNGNPYPQGAFSFNSVIPSATVAASNCGNCGVSATTGPGVASSGFANFLLGNTNGTGANGGAFTQASTVLVADIRQNLFEGYVQDDWRITPRLTLNLGVRYSYFQQPTDAFSRLTNFDPTIYDRSKAPTVNSTGTLCRVGSTCTNANGLNTGAPNASADYINGIIVPQQSQTAINGYSLTGHYSRFGSNMGTTQNTNIAPRLGFAFDVFGDGRTALRGGYGTAYDQSAVSYYETPIFSNLPYVNQPTLPVSPFDCPGQLPGCASTGASPTISSSLPSVTGSPLEYKTPYTTQYSLDLQQQFSSTAFLDVGYFGSIGRNLLGKVDLNTLQPGAYVAAGISPTGVTVGGAQCAGFTTSTCEQQLQQIRPFVGYQAVNVVRSIFSSNYNGLQVSFRKQWSGLSYINANYTWSRALTNAQNDYSTAPQNVYNINADYGRAVYDRTNIVSLNGVFELPWYRDQKGLVGHLVGGWELTGLYALNSGLPLTVSGSGGFTSGSPICYSACALGQTQISTTGATNGGIVNDAAGLGIFGASAAGYRPNMISDPNNGNGNRIHTRLNWFNRTAFVAPAVGSLQVGNERRGVIEGPGFNRLDIGIFRNFKIFEGVNLQLRGEAFNVANHTNWQAVGTTSTTTSTSVLSGFGVISDTRDPRIMQVAGKITF